MPGLTPFQMMQGLFGGQMPSSGLSLLGGGLPANVLSLLGPQPAPGAAAAAGTPTIPLSPLQRASQIGDLMNRNAYGTADPQHLGQLGSAGFPLFSDPRMVQGYLGTMAQNGDEDAAEALRRMLGGASAWGGRGAYGGGEGEMGSGGGGAGASGGGAGQDASGKW